MGDAFRGREISGDIDGIDRTRAPDRSYLGPGGDADPLDYWRSPLGLEDITPRGKQWPEGDGFGAFLTDLVGWDSVLEFGCGIGRLAGCFDPARYVGVDVSSFAIDVAIRSNPDYWFHLLVESLPLPTADLTLAHTVLLHVPDDALRATVERFNSPRVVISEILGKHWRRTGNPPVFNREAADYERAMLPKYRLTSHSLRPYPHYQNTNLSVMEFIRC